MKPQNFAHLTRTQLQSSLATALTQLDDARLRLSEYEAFFDRLKDLMKLDKDFVKREEYD